ncbi:MAG: hypothetical protein IPI73_24025 [Betaproteobacteria bacterium]|nr:hypothetical protein [Betaproteobacteria bacterium]
MVEITYFSDVLCIWAYASQARIDAVKDTFGDAVRIEHRFCSVFADDRKDRRGLEGQGRICGVQPHLRQVAGSSRISVHPQIWLKTRPLTSASAHLFMKAVQQWDRNAAVTKVHPQGRIRSGAVGPPLRSSATIGTLPWDVQCEIAEALAWTSRHRGVDSRWQRICPPRTTRMPTKCGSKAARASC